MLVVTALLVINTIRVARTPGGGGRDHATGGGQQFHDPNAVPAGGGGIRSDRGLIAVGALVAAKVFLIDQVLAPSYRFTAFVSWDQVIVILPIVFLTGILIAAIAAALTLRRYLRCEGTLKGACPLCPVVAATAGYVT